jgi:hypothetical protein
MSFITLRKEESREGIEREIITNERKDTTEDDHRHSTEEEQFHEENTAQTHQSAGLLCRLTKPRLKHTFLQDTPIFHGPWLAAKKALVMDDEHSPLAVRLLDPSIDHHTNIDLLQKLSPNDIETGEIPFPPAAKDKKGETKNLMTTLAAFKVNQIFRDKEGVKYKVSLREGETIDQAMIAWIRHERVLMMMAEPLQTIIENEHKGDPMEIFVENVNDAKEVAAWQYYWDLRGGKLESLIPLILGITVKSLQENEADDKLNLKATITFKLPINPIFSKQKKLLESMKLSARELLEGIGLNINKETNQTLQARNFKLNKTKDGKSFSDYSMSDHIVVDIDSSGFLDYCPFNLAEYNLSIKLNALESDGPRGKVKLVWQSRTPSDFLQFQFTSIGSSVSHNDTICILPKYKKEKDLIEFKSRPQDPNQELIFHEVIGEVDELVISFHTKSNQIKNLTNIVLPCAMVPIIVALSNDRESKIQLLLAALLTMVFTMPGRFKLGTMFWYVMALILTVIAFAAPSTRRDIRWISVLFTGVFLIIAFYFQRQHSNLNKISIRALTKDAVEQTPLEKFLESLSLE